MEETRTAAGSGADTARSKVVRKPAPGKTDKKTKAAKPAATKSVAVKTRAVKPAVPAPSVDREEWIRVAAYYRAERRGFVPGHELDDWVEAEAALPHRDAPERAVAELAGAAAAAKRRARPRKQGAAQANVTA